MTVEIKLIGQESPVRWDDEVPVRPAYREYAYLVLSSGALRVDCTVHQVDEQGYASDRGPVTEVVYGPHAWEQVTGDGNAGA